MNSDDLLDDYRDDHRCAQMITDALLFLTTSPGKAGLRVQAGDGHTRGYGAACRGPPVVRERSGIIWTLRPNRIPGPMGWRDDFRKIG
jgi:hypothetical protein